MTSRSGLRLASFLGLVVALGGCKITSASDDGDGQGGGGGGADAARAPFFLPTGEPDNTAAPAIELAADGRIHAVFPAYAGGRAYYATCAADCAGPDDMRVVRFDTDSTVANAMLALDAQGRPRVLLSTFDKVYFATCEADCGDGASWAMTELLDHRGDREVSGEAFALDPDGHPQKAPETYYVTCDGDCHDPVSWTQHKVADQIWQSSSLRFDAQGGAHLATVAHVVLTDGSTQRFGAYVACDRDCDTSQSWVGQGLEAAFYSDYDAVSIAPAISLDLTADGAPRVAVLGQDEASQRRIVYFACDEDCTSEGAFTGLILSDEHGIGPGLDLALDAQDRPRIAYTLDYNIGLMVCDDADCTAEGAGWDVAKVELGGEMDPDEIFLWENCNVAAWFLHSPSVAIGPSGLPRVGYQARDISGGWENPDPTKPDCEAGTDMTWSRLAMMGPL